MCLITSQYEPYIAQKDIPVVKALEIDGVNIWNNYRTPYTKTPVMLDNMLCADGKYHYDNSCEKHQLGEGLIHAYRAMPVMEFACIGLIHVRAYIPKGTKFFVSDDFTTIGAEKLYILGGRASYEDGLTMQELVEIIQESKNTKTKKMKDQDNHDRLDPGHKIGLIILLFIFMLFVTRACAQTAQYDTAAIKYQNIERIVSQTTDKGTTRYYAVYNDKQENISELIPVSKTVLMYIDVCKQNHIEPSLAIRLKNGIIVGLIRYKTKYVVKRNR